MENCDKYKCVQRYSCEKEGGAGLNLFLVIGGHLKTASDVVSPSQDRSRGEAGF